MTIIRFVFAILLVAVLADTREASAQVLDKQKQLEAQSFWDNRDWDWYAEQIPFFECPDADITTTYYYRWELLTKHLTYGSPNSGYSFTEFIDRPFWSGAYGAISCPAGHQLYEARWLRQPRIARDYLKYWFRTPGAQPRNYSTWLADSAWAVNQVHRDDGFAIDLLPDLVRNYEGWEQRHFVKEVGLFWQTGHDDGMEFNINSRQTKDILRGAPSYRPSFNAYMWADAVAIAKLARLAGKDDIAERFENKAESLKATMLKLLWDDKRQFFFPVYKNDEERDGHKIKTLTKTYEDGQFAGDSHGRELIGYVPWQFNMFDPQISRNALASGSETTTGASALRLMKYEAAWSKLMDRDGFYSDFGPSTVERNDPMFLLQNSCCWWSGQSWPYATTQTLKALANVVPSVSEAGAGRDVPVTDAAVRNAVTRSLPFLEREGIAWINDRGCMSCHHVPFMLWSHRAAQAQGLKVDVQKLAEWDDWSRKDSLSHRNSHRLQNYELGKVGVEKLPMVIRDKLRPLIEQPFKTEAEFLTKLTPLLTEDELKSYQEIVVKTAEREANANDRNGGGLDVIALLLLGGQGTQNELTKPEFRDGVIDLMHQLQLPDGSWTPGNQLATLRRWSLPTANQVTTMWATLAQAAYEMPGQKRSPAVVNAISYQRQQIPAPDNYEWLATRLLFEKNFGAAEEVAKLRQQLIEVRNGDGGWGWEKGVASDAFTTGLAIYVLAKVGSGNDSAVFRDARKLLLSTQHADGSWPTPAKNLSKSTEPERLKVRDEIYHYWGTAWAAIGLLETLGKSEVRNDVGDVRAAMPTKADYVKLMAIYAKSHRKNGKPYLAEALHPDTGSFEGHDGYNHSEHYFHSGFCDLVITGLVGLTPRDDETLEVNPLAPPEWDYFALDDVPYRGHRVSIVWDKTGERYKLGAGLHVLVDGKEVAKSDELERLVVEHAARVPSDGSTTREPRVASTPTNFVVNNDGTYFPRLTASYSSPKTSVSKLNDGNFWYVPHPPNRWTCEGSPNERDWVVIDFGVKRTIHTVKLYPLDDSGEKDAAVRTPQRIELEAWINDEWRPIKSQSGVLDKPQGHRANVVKFDPIEVAKLRLTLHHRPDGKSGLSEIEAWGDVQLPLEAAPPPAGNLAYNPKPDGFPKASASFTDRFGGKPFSAIDGKTVFLPTPMNRWTSYESKSETDWLEIDFGREVEFRRVELAIYDDRGGVQPPTSYVIQHWTGTEWREVANAKKSPDQPLGSQWNEAKFDPVKSSKTRIVFTHRGQSRSGVSEVLIWND